MNEIKFRGMDANGIMRYGRLSQDKPNETVYYKEYSQRICWDVFNIPVKNSTLGQYTGLNDKNNKEIYNKDILKFDISGNGLKYNPLEALMVVVEYKNASWGFKHLFPELVVEEDRNWSAFWRSDDEEIWDTNYFEVLGNKYENPELLGAK